MPTHGSWPTAPNFDDYAVVSHKILRNVVEPTAPLSPSRPTPLFLHAAGRCDLDPKHVSHRYSTKPENDKLRIEGVVSRGEPCEAVFYFIPGTAVLGLLGTMVGAVLTLAKGSVPPRLTGSTRTPFQGFLTPTVHPFHRG